MKKINKSEHKDYRKYYDKETQNIDNSTFLTPITESIVRKSFDPSTLMWYTKPAEEWEKALPVGNGRLGAMVFGGVKEERIQLRELKDELKSVYVMSHMRDIESSLRGNVGDLEKEIPFWEFLDIEFEIMDVLYQYVKDNIIQIQHLMFPI